MSEPILAEVLKALKAAIFQRDEQRRFWLIGASPEWLSMLWPQVTANGGLLRADASPFIENFLIDAAVCWETGAERVQSGPWVEQDSLGGHHHLEAIALSADGRAILLIEEMGPAYAERVSLLQTAHEAALDYEKLQRTEEALAEQSRLLESRVRERTGQLSASRERLRELSLRLVKLQEDERRFFARELHDEIGQLLTGVKLSLDLVREKVDERCRPAIAESLSMLSELLERVRRLSLKLRPQMLDDLGLMPSLEWHFRQYRAQTGIDLEFDQQLNGARFDDTVETAIYRIVQESLTNAARHARATRAAVRLHLGNSYVRLEIADNGVGFDVAAAQQRPSTGISSMSERAELLGGSLFIESNPGAGTRVIVELPSAPAKAQCSGRPNT
jgi:signal transduction histidine kinase